MLMLLPSLIVFRPLGRNACSILFDAISSLAENIWGVYTVVPVLVCGIVLSAYCGCPQLRIRGWMSATIGDALRKAGKSRAKGGISPFQTATAALAGTIGTGNIVGVAAALSVGGPSSIFWMCTTAVVMMGISYAENRLGVIWRGTDSDGGLLGGPMMYMERGLGMKGLAVFWAATCSVAAFGVGNIAQVNSISSAAERAFGCPTWLSGAAIAVLTAPAVINGVSGAVKLTEKLVPLMAAAYILACAAVVVINIDKLPEALSQIFAGVFEPRSAAGGLFGSMLSGVRRGVFTNEAGMGSSVMMNSSADTNDAHAQGCWGIFEVFFDTIVICSLTALALLTSGAYVANGTKGAAAMNAAAFECVFGCASGIFVTVCLLLFAFSTLVCWGVTGEKAVRYICGSKHNAYAGWYKYIYIAVIPLGAVMNVSAVWASADIINAMLLLPNLTAVVLLTIRMRQNSEILPCHPDTQHTTMR